MGYIKDWFTKISCHHDWEVHARVQRWADDLAKRPTIVDETLICKKCGKIVKITL